MLSYVSDRRLRVGRRRFGRTIWTPRSLPITGVVIVDPGGTGILNVIIIIELIWKYMYAFWKWWDLYCATS